MTNEGWRVGRVRVPRFAGPADARHRPDRSRVGGAVMTSNAEARRDAWISIAIFLLIVGFGLVYWIKASKDGL